MKKFTRVEQLEVRKNLKEQIQEYKSLCIMFDNKFKGCLKEDFENALKYDFDTFDMEDFNLDNISMLKDSLHDSIDDYIIPCISDLEEIITMMEDFNDFDAYGFNDTMSEIIPIENFENQWKYKKATLRYIKPLDEKQMLKDTIELFYTLIDDGEIYRIHNCFEEGYIKVIYSNIGFDGVQVMNFIVKNNRVVKGE